ncbi:MAG: hypothetical protein M1820_004481 [Bogoriella megaspora]|nr:MAG: hypothetical protein M1820_004481 [Bogoriella megaspora]
MSAIPNIPENISHPNGTNPEDLHVRNRADAEDVEIPHIGDTAEENGISDGTNASTNRASSKRSFRVHDAPVENHRPIKVIVIGAGYSAHSYQYSFDPNPSWSSLYAPGAEIRSYLDTIARRYGVERFTKFKHQIRHCVWDADEGRWHIRVKDLNTGHEIEETSDILLSARGNLNNISWPKIPGLNEFQGEVMHSAKWNESYDFTGKRIGVIGCGSSAIQIIPQLQKLPQTQLSCFIRGRTWISPSFGSQLFSSLGLNDFIIPEARIKQFLENPPEYEDFRQKVEEDGNAIHGVTLKNHPVQLAGQTAFEEGMRDRLSRKPEIYDKMLPSFAPGCRRLTPGPGFLEALCEDNVKFIPQSISRIESTGVRTYDSQLHNVDVLVCATGFHVSAPPPFPVIGSNGTPLTQHWSKRATNYLSLATDNFPNHFMMLGPNAAIGSGSLTMMIEAVGDYIVKCVRKIQKENVKSMAIKKERVDDFVEYADAYFEKTVFMDQCRSWYKTVVDSGEGKEDKVTGLWPGSTLHCIEALRSPRWEDYDYESLPEPVVDGEGDGDEGRKKKRPNAMAWLGNGWSENQIEGRDLAWYLQPKWLDERKPVPLKPEENEVYKARAFSH